MCLFLGSLCYDLCVNFCFDYCSFVLLSEHQKHDISSFVLFQDFSVCVFLFYVCGSVLILGLFILLLLSNCSVMSDSLQPHGLQHARPLCPSPSPGICSNSCPLSPWCHSTILSSVVPSPPAFNLSQHQGLFQWVDSSYQMAKVLEFPLQHQSFQWIFRVVFS